MKRLRDQPFAVEAFFEESLVLTFACPKERLQHLVPSCFELDTFEDRWAFMAVAMVQTSALRPRGFPKFLGRDFFLIGHRVFVRHVNAAGKRLRGLYILRSETDSPWMQALGNLFTRYRYGTTDIRVTTDGPWRMIHSDRSGIEVVYRPDEHDVDLPAGSPFTGWREARRFAGPLPHTFSYDEAEGTVLTIRGMRDHWEPRPVAVDRWRSAFIDDLGIPDLVLASAFGVSKVPYHWEKGRKEPWMPHADGLRA